MTRQGAIGATASPAGNARRAGRLYAAHLALAAAFALGRMLRYVQGATLDDETSFVTSPAGRAVALVAIVVGIAALVAVAVLTVRERRDPRALALAVLLCGAIASRDHVDALDLAYLAASFGAALWWILGGRKRSRPSTALPPTAPSA